MTRKSCVGLLLFVLGLQMAWSQPFALTNAPAGAPGAPEFVPGEVLIKFRADVTDEQIATAFRGASLQLVKQVQTPAMRDKGDIGITRTLTRLPVQQAVGLLGQLPGIEYAQPNWIYTHQATSNDPLFTGGSLWGMYGGASTPANDFGSHAAEAWLTGAGSRDVCVGIIDEGIQYYHEDLQANIWVNPNDAGDSSDNDGNGYVDDIYGWDFYQDNNTVYDGTPSDKVDHHGTHVAGTIGAIGGNGVGAVGVNWNVNMISGKFLGPSGGTTADAVQAIDYMTSLKTEKGVNIVALNNSWGGGGYDAALLAAIVRAAQAEILFVASAGNGNWAGRAINTDRTPQYPACYDTTAGAEYDAVISVTAIDSAGLKPIWANYGAKTVDLGAPGVGIFSTVPGDYASYSGTSMAAPHVTGAIAVYAAKYPGAKAASIKKALLAATTPTPSLSSTVTGGRLDLVKFLAIAPEGWVPPTSSAPVAPSDLSAAAISHKEVKLDWTDNSNNETEFQITRQQISVDAAVLIKVPANVTSYTDVGLTADTEYSYTIQACNSVGCSLPPTATVTARTLSAPVPATATYVGYDAETKGWWVNKYGGEGYKLVGYEIPPTYATEVKVNAGTHTWENPTPDDRALQKPPPATDRYAACWASSIGPSSFDIDLRFTDYVTHRVSLYCLDWEPQDRQQKIDVYDLNSNQLLTTGSVSLTGYCPIAGGIYLIWDISGPVKIRVTHIEPFNNNLDNAVVSGIFFGAVPLGYSEGLPLPAPSGLTAKAVSTTAIDLSWVDNSSNETGFIIERSTSATEGFEVKGQVGPGVTKYQDTGLTKSTTYYYRVYAVKSDNSSSVYSPHSNIASAKTLRR